MKNLKQHKEFLNVVYYTKIFTTNPFSIVYYYNITTNMISIVYYTTPYEISTNPFSIVYYTTLNVLKVVSADR